MTKSKLITINTTDNINVQLTQEEIRDRAIISVQVASELDQAEAEFGGVKRDWQKKLKEIQGRLKAVRRCVETGEEFREVSCERMFDPKRGVTWLSFEGNKYLERPMTDDEIELVRQGDMEEFFNQEENI